MEPASRWPTMQSSGVCRRRRKVPVTNYIWDVENDSYLTETNRLGASIAMYGSEPSAWGNSISQRMDVQASYFHDDVPGLG